MVKLEFSGMCEGCKVADLELEESADGSWEVRCAHEKACEWIQRQFIPSDPHKYSEPNLYRQRSALGLGAME